MNTSSLWVCRSRLQAQTNATCNNLEHLYGHVHHAIPMPGLARTTLAAANL